MAVAAASATVKPECETRVHFLIDARASTIGKFDLEEDRLLKEVCQSIYALYEYSSL